MTSEEFNRRVKELEEKKQAFLKEHPDFVPDADFWELHSCEMFADELGYCQWCGGVVFGSYAYNELYGGD